MIRLAIILALAPGDALAEMQRLRPETQQFWIDTATRILAALEVTK